MSSDQTSRANRRLAVKLVLVTVAMFGFGFALVPLYDVFCTITGIGGKTGRIDAQAASAGQVDESRLITIEFTSSVSRGMPWEFRPAVTRMQVHPGEVVTTSYYARNTTDEAIIGQAVPSVTPVAAANYFKKIECFCFTQQELKAKEGRAMPVRYVVDPKLPADVRTITLSYTFFNTDKNSAERMHQAVAGAQEHDHGAHAH